MVHQDKNTFPVRRAALPFLLLLLCVSLTGCATLKEWFGFNDESTIQKSASSLAVEAMEEFNVGKYYKAVEKFEEIMDRFPFSPEAMLAELKAADSHYFMEEYPEAKILYQEFEDRHPTNEAIPYVMFQIGMCDFARTDRVDRDISGAKDAIQSFSRLLRAFPNSPYTSEAKSRIKAAREFLVNHEYFVAVFYVRTKRYDEAAHRLKYLLTMYPDAAISPKAKEMLAKIEAGTPPRMGFSKWLPDLSMPDWTLFGSNDKQEETETETQEK